jgi:hypothetical protein
MKFYEVYYPYYALIKAKDKEEAMKIYTKFVADDDGTLHEELNEVERDYALTSYCKATFKVEDVSIRDVLESFQNNESRVLLIDGSL